MSPNVWRGIFDPSNNSDMKTTSGHLTSQNIKAIKAIMQAGLECGKVGRTNYFISKDGSQYKVIIKSMTRGLIPCAGSELRLSTFVATFTI